MKKKKLIISTCTLLLTSLLVTGCGKEIEVKNGSKVAVAVKGGKITATEYYKEIKNNNISTLVDMIDKQLLEKKYPTTKEEDEKVTKQITQLKESYGNEEMFNSVLKQYFGVNTEEELDEMLRLEYKRNEAVKDFIEDNLKEKEIEKYYENEIYGEVKASHIIIIPSVSEDATEDEIAEAEKEAKKTAEKVIKKLKDGEDFAKLAKKYSNEEATASNGGDLGYFELDEMVDEFSNAVKELKINEYTKEPVKTEYGYHVILKTDEKEKAKLKDVKNEIKEKITLQKLDSDPTLYYQTLINIREKYEIKWNDTVLEKQYNELMEQLINSAKETQS